MIACIDATPLTVSSGGVRRYTEELTRALARLYPEDRFHLVSDQYGSGNIFDRRWWSIGVQLCMSRLRCDVFHGTEFSVPYVPLRPSVLTLHDLSPWMDPSWHHAAERVRKRTPALIRLGIATMIVTPTEAIRRQAIDYFRLHPSRVVAVPHAAAAHLRPMPTPAGQRPYFLFVGTIEPRKDVPTLVQAWRALRERRDVDLIVAGRMRADAPPLPAESGLTLLGEVREEQIASLYSGAVACVYTSAYEGFGFPALEAMQCGCPVIASKDQALMEVSAGAAVHVQSGDAGELASMMEMLLICSEERERRRELGLRRAGEFSWERTARLTREVYDEAIRRA
jgi:glycosyltransferase involved in cell wall biosynthesis